MEKVIRVSSQGFRHLAVRGFLEAGWAADLWFRAVHNFFYKEEQTPKLVMQTYTALNLVRRFCRSGLFNAVSARG